MLPGLKTTGKTPKVVVTFVYDGGGWNVLRHWPDDWPHLKRLMGGGANYRNALTGSFPAVTACAHATIGTGSFPRTHGITGHNIRADASGSRKAYLEPGNADPSTILVPTLADLYSDATDNAAWVGEIGYQIWHMGMIGYGGKSRPAGQKPVGVYWDEGSASWRPHNPELFRLPATEPGQDVYAAHQAGVHGARLGPGVHAPGRPVDLLQPAGRPVPARSDRRDARLRADRARRPVAALHHLQVARLHRAHLQHVLEVGGPDAAIDRRAARARSSTTSRRRSPASTC